MGRDVAPLSGRCDGDDFPDGDSAYRANVDWERITLFWADERAGTPVDDPDSNYGLAERMLLSPLGAQRAAGHSHARGHAESWGRRRCMVQTMRWRPS